MPRRGPDPAADGRQRRAGGQRRHGVTGEAIIVTARLVDAPLFKQAMVVSRASLGIIASTFVYESVIRHGQDLAGYAQVQVEVKEASMPAWMRLFGPATTGPRAALPEPRQIHPG